MGQNLILQTIHKILIVISIFVFFPPEFSMRAIAWKRRQW